MIRARAQEVNASVGSLGDPRPLVLPGGEDDTQAWRLPGVVAGIAGAAAVAIVFLILDLGSGRPMWTPSAMGSLLFRGGPLSSEIGWVPVLALGYTLVHGTIFLGIGTVAAQLLSTTEPGSKTPWSSPLGLGVILFASFELTFLCFALLFDTELFSRLGAGPVAVANLAAAAVMAGVLRKQL